MALIRKKGKLRGRFATFLQNHMDDPGPKGEPGYVPHAYAIAATGQPICSNGNYSTPIANKAEDWWWITDKLNPEQKEAFYHNCKIMEDWIKENRPPLYICGVNFLLWPIFGKIAEGSLLKLDNPEKFYDYFKSFVLKVYPHYQNIVDKSQSETQGQGPVIDIEDAIINDFTNNVLNILAQDDEENI